MQRPISAKLFRRVLKKFVTPKEEEEDVRNATEIMQNALEEALDKLDKPAGRLIRRLAR